MIFAFYVITALLAFATARATLHPGGGEDRTSGGLDADLDWKRGLSILSTKERPA